MACSATAGSIEFNQARNGSAQAPESPAVWVKGNAGSSSSHYVETQSIPYRLVLGDLQPGSHRLIIEWDTRRNGKHAIDFITHFNRLQPHDVFGGHQTPETIDPLSGLIGTFDAPATYVIPAPSAAGSPVSGQPATSFSLLPEPERLFTIWNGVITNVVYLNQDPLTIGSSSTRLQMDFTSAQPTVVVAWGGHIASQFDWGVEESAIGINGSPYHTRVISLDGTGGNQDLSLQILPILPPPPCGIAGPATMCATSTAAYAAPNASLAPGVTYTWSITDQGTGAAFIGLPSGPAIEIQAAHSGTFTLHVTVDVGGTQSVCSQTVEVRAATGASALADQFACASSEVTFATVPLGTGPFQFVWTKNGTEIPGAVGPVLTLSNVSESDEGEYCVEVTGTCGTVQTCAALVVYSLPTATAPPDIVVQCVADVPVPDSTLVLVEGGLAPIQVEHTGDEFSVQGCVVNVLRIYLATDACGKVATCTQSIRVEDTIAPVLQCAPDKIVEAASTWSFDAPTATDNCSPQPSISPAGPATIPSGPGGLGRTTQSWQAVDACGNTSICSQTVTVVDTTPPVVTCPDAMNFPCPGPAGVQVFYEPTATDLADPDVRIVCTPTSGSSFTLGIHTVTCVATDFSGNESTCTITVTIFDDVPPTIHCPQNMVVAESSPGSHAAVVTFPAPVAEDICDADLTIVCVPPSGSVFPAGVTTVNCTATDDAGNSAVCTFTVQVVPVTIVTTSTADSGPGTLRQGLMDANASPGGNIIAFDLPGSGPYVIRLLSPLPEVVDTLVMDGTTQPGFILEPVVEVNGDEVVPDQRPLTAGMVVTSSHAIIRGLTLNGFDYGLVLGGGGGHLVEDTFIGVDTTGTVGLGNILAGILVQSPTNTIGTPGHGNVISANHGPGIILDSPAASGNVIQGNFIGVGAGGTLPLGNLGHGILSRNGAAQNLIGGTLPGAGNVIAFNGGSGIALEATAGSGHAILGNTMLGNSNLGIDLGADGVTPNAETQPGGGAAPYPSYPENLSVYAAFGSTTVQGTLHGRPGDRQWVECFLNTAPDPTGYGEGDVFLGGAAVDLDETGRGEFSFSFPGEANFDQWISATATDSESNTSEFSVAVQVGGPPIIIVQPVGSSVSLGAPTMVCVTAVGTQPLTYQWRRNGANIPLATNACFSIPSARLVDGGHYTVVVANRLGAVTSESADILLILPTVAAGDNFAQRVALAGLTGLASGTNIAATRELNEPEHFGKAGGKSVWYTWTAPDTGIATFGTTGSTFDTLLAVYSGTALTNLVVEGDDEDSGGFYTSGVRFNALEGTTYHIAIDGFGGAYGDFVFTWNLQISDHLLPVILARPQNQTVPLGGTAMFNVQALNTCHDGHHNCRHPDKNHHAKHEDDVVPLYYQWLFNGVPIARATNATLIVATVDADDIGAYAVRVSDDYQSVTTLPAWLQINMTGDGFQTVQSEDKFLDAARSPNPLRLGGFTTPAVTGTEPGTQGFGGGTVARGYTGSHVFTTSRSSTEIGDVLICDVPGGATEWMIMVPEATGMLHLNTQGSKFDTLLAAFAYSVTNAPFLDQLGCNDNAATNVTYSAITVPVVAGRTNFIIVDGRNGAFGSLQLNYSLIVDASFSFVGSTPAGVRMRVAGRPNLNLSVQGSTDLSQWTPLVTSNAPSGVFEFTDPQSKTMPRRYYRAVLLP